jgi:hypothetical protein
MTRIAIIALAAPVALASALLVPGDVWAQGCAMCKASLPGAEDPLSRGFNYSIFVFLGVTYSLIGLVGGWIGYRYWRAGRPRSEPRVLRFELARKEEPS